MLLVVTTNKGLTVVTATAGKCSICKSLHIFCENPALAPNAANYSYMFDLIAMAGRCRRHGTRWGFAFGTKPHLTKLM